MTAVPPPPAPPRAVAAAGTGRPGWITGVAVAVIVVVLAGIGAFAYFKFLKPPPETVASTVAAAPASTVAVASPVATPVPAASAATVALSSAAATDLAVTMAPSSASSVASAASNAEAVANAPTAPAPTVEAPVAQPAATPPPVDHTLQMAQDLVHRGERAYARGDYENAYRHARSALDVRPGYAPAERLLHRADATQQQVATEQAQAQQTPETKATGGRQAAAAAAAAPPKPTPDQLYNQRAHDECARGMFGKSCRHKVRVEVCQGVEAGSPGATVCQDLKD